MWDVWIAALVAGDVAMEILARVEGVCNGLVIFETTTYSARTR